MANDFDISKIHWIEPNVRTSNAFCLGNVYQSSTCIVPPSDWASPYVSFSSDSSISRILKLGATNERSSTQLVTEDPTFQPPIFTDSTLNFSSRLLHSSESSDCKHAVTHLCSSQTNAAISEFIYFGNQRDEGDANLRVADGIDSRTSESGWTAYLDQSNDWTGHESYSGAKPMRKDCCSFGKNGNNHDSGVGTLADKYREDPSMASDASSGPEQPEFVRRECLKRCKAKIDTDDVKQEEKEEGDLDDTCQSNVSCESVSDDRERNYRQLKRRKLEREDKNSDDVDHHQMASKIGDGHSDENHVDKRVVSEAEICSYPSPPKNLQAQAVECRLEMLQDLIPNGQQLDEEEMLEVAINYVKSLETKIKMFEGVVMDRKTLAEAAVAAATAAAAAAGALQEKGLCLIPISMLATATSL